MRITKNIFLLFFIFNIFIINNVDAQMFSNNWINYNQNYYKIKVTSDGIHRISYSALLSAGIPVGSINPQNFQIFGRGKEQYIYIYNQVNGIMSAGDYIEFFAQKNDGWLDTALYNNNSHQPNIQYSLFNDTATYFLTWNNLFNNKRLTQINDINFAPYQPANSIIKVVYQGFNSYYLEGMPLRESNDETTWDPEYVNGEGFYGNPFYLGGSVSYNVSTKNAISSGNAMIRFLVHGASNYRSLINDHHLKVVFAGQQIDTIFEGYQVIRFEKQIPASSLGTNTTSFVFSSINDLGSQADRNAVAYIEITYPHNLDFQANNYFEFFVDDQSQNKANLTVSNFVGGNFPVLYDLSNNRRIAITKNLNNYQFLIPNGNGRKKCVLVGETSIINVSSLQPVSSTAKFKNYFSLFPNANYLIITHKSLMNSNSGLLSASDYASYRNSKGKNVMLVDVDDLYDQFSFGVAKTPIAIRNFLYAAHNQLNSIDKQVFLIGKSYYPQVYRKDQSLYNQTLVPSFGSPPSDVLLSSYIADATYKPAFATGRLAAINLDHVDLYLKKVMIYEDPIANPPASWKKQALFFSGGDLASLQTLLAGYMKGYEMIYEDTSFGGNVETFYKTSSDPIQINLSEAIKKHINGGVNILNFFGHAAGIGFDISIDNPAEYNNYGKYPLLIANSCLAGDVFQPNVGVVNSSEAFILIRDKGAIAYLGSVTPGTPAYLNLYTKSFFRHYSSVSYGKPLGAIVKNSIGDIYSTYPQTKEIIMEMLLHGDPALIINSYELPDYEITESSISFLPKVITTEYDSLKISLVINNLGKAVNDSMVVEIERILPDLKTKQLRSVFFKSTKFSDTLNIWFPINKFDDLGRNSIQVRIDANSNIVEMKENNNTYSYFFVVQAADLKPVYPPEFSIVSSQAPSLKASTFYPLSSENTYVFQVDTTADFNSPLLEVAKIKSVGGVVYYIVNQPLIDSVVYYWRVAIDSTSSKGFNWRSSSFHYIPYSSGWSQSHFYQFEKNSYQLTVFNRDNRKFEFVNDIKVVKCINGIYPHIAWNMPQYLINNVQYSYWQCLSNGMKIAVIDPVSGNPWYNQYIGTNFGPDGNYTCRNYNYASFEFSTEDFPPGSNLVTDSAWYQRTANFIAKIPDGYLVLARSAQNSFITNWPEYLRKSYDSIGANFHRGIPSNRPYIIWGVKGQLGGATELIGDSTEAIINLVDSFTTKWTEGYMATNLIGPTQKWNSLNWKVSSQDPINTDEVYLALVGIKSDGSADTIFKNMPVDSSQIFKLNDRMPANIYPFCKLVVFMKDDSLHTPPFINSLQVFYSEVPEFAVDPKTVFSFYSDTIQRGDTMKIQIAYRNISNIDLMDSLMVKYWVIDNDNIHHDLMTRKISTIPAQNYIVDTFNVVTTNLIGNCSFFLEINPIDTSTNDYDILELSHINNSLEVPFLVIEDQSNPILDVTFDGIHILDGDIVSSKPEILISLLDDNQFIAVDDTSLFNIYLTTPGNFFRKRIYFFNSGVEQLQFVPAELPNNKAKVIYKPIFDSDGQYILTVQAVDPALNLAGRGDYQIKFNVINKSTITQLMNWPNPFTTKTHFVFTLTGSQLPDYMLIQIITISGKVVREITMEELGPIHIGRNITEYAWDGTDEFGDRLANGVYLYRVITKLNNEAIEHRESGADSYFKKSFGKMYLMR
jgi:hypothetical protein